MMSSARVFMISTAMVFMIWTAMVFMMWTAMVFMIWTVMVFMIWTVRVFMIWTGAPFAQMKTKLCLAGYASKLDMMLLYNFISNCAAAHTKCGPNLH